MLHSVILIPVPTADSVIGEWRRKYDKVALHGIPSHITLLFPFKDPHQITQGFMMKLKKVFTKVKQFSFILNMIDTFPGVIFLNPKPKEKFIELTKDIVKVFPENPPYEGKYPSINPHATIAQLNNSGNTEELKNQISLGISTKLPIRCVAREAWLMIEDENGEWHIHSRFPFLL
jgi:2'-5' RNA ligase